MAQQWYYYKDGQQEGPYSKDQLQGEAQAGNLKPDDLVWAEGMTDWIPAQKVAGLIPAQAPPPSQAAAPPPPQAGPPPFQPSQSQGAPPPYHGTPSYGHQPSGPGHYGHYAPPKKGKGGMIALIAILLVLLLGGGALVYYFFFSDDGPVATTGQGPDEVVEEYFQAMARMDFERARGFVSSNYMAEFNRDIQDIQDEIAMGGEEAALIESIFKAMLGKMDVRPTGYNIDGDRATVSLDLTVPDMDQFEELLMGQLFTMMFNPDFEDMSEEELMGLMADLMGDVIRDVGVVNETGEARLVKEDGQWKIDSDFLGNILDDMDF